MESPLVNLIGARKQALPVAAAILAAATWASPLAAQEPSTELPEKSSGREHVVRKGDTLWDLANFYLSNPFHWPQIYEANRATITDPHWIYPNDRIIIPGLPTAVADGVLTAVSGATGETVEAVDPRLVNRTRFYRSTSAQEELDAANEAFEADGGLRVAAVQPKEFYAAPWLADRGKLDIRGELVRVRGRTGGGMDRLAQSVHPFDIVYLRYSGKNRPEVGDRLVMIREGRSFGRWGKVFEPTAVVEVQELAKDVMTAKVVEQFGRLGPGDKAIPEVEFPGVAPGRAQPIDGGPEAKLLGFLDEQPVYDPSDPGFINLGRKDGLVLGDELVVLMPQQRAGGGYYERLPEDQIARLRVIRVEEETATVRLIHIDQPSIRSGLPVRLVAKMP